ncbi:Outer membrane receptor proteins, mostly Fe transport [Chitinophaga ginsengisegetis]|uniref:Outer membrane receptor proteins, mostly Fe transport n=1 Tax=Chitinophaga ginsengisegetis TaxID=393003 RepID=A0A1T5N906_9BACT|nr:TonB-dependent receptor [Chitinophaga ginsengisegetis]SKC96967.1 Outer membrane receptor proteins, mostly Fe transport [Chitinophaga ginsengisegetis]
MRTIIVALGMLFIGVQTTLAQQTNSTGKITLTITDHEGKPLPFTSVMVRNIKDSSLVKGELTTTNGSCAFEKIAYGHYFIQASQMGYNTSYSKTFLLNASHKAITLDTIRLNTLGKNLQAVNVTAQKPFIESSAGKTVMNIENSVSAAGNTALDLLRRAPGVQVDNNENVTLKGQSVTVMIDGKLTYLSGEQLTNLLKTTPGESIASIEILTSPSAKYDASGNGGIINIKTKKGKMTGINGNVNATLTQSRYGRYGISGNVNWRTEKFNLFGNFDQGDYPRQVTRVYSRNVKENDGSSTYLQQNIFQRNRFKNNYLKIGMDYFINDKQTIGVLANGYKNSFSNQIYSDANLGQANMPPDSIVNSLTTNNNKFDNIALNLNYKIILDTAGGREISFDADYAQFNNHRLMQLNDSLYDAKTQLNRNPNSIRTTGSTQVLIKSLKADLSWPLGKEGKLEAGAKTSFVTTTNLLQFDSLFHGSYKPSPGLSDRFNYQENIYAAYATYKKQIQKTNVQLGLRVENTESTGTSFTTGTNVKRSYVDFFPNITVEQKLNDKNKVSLAMSRRIERPQYGQLNPFMFYLDKYTYFRGNPYLRPQYSNIAEVAYTFKDKYIVTFRYSRIKDMMEEFITQDDSTKASISTERNYDKTDIYSILFTLPFQFTKWWTSDNNADFSYNKYRFEDPVTNDPYYRSNLNYYISSTNTITLPKDFKVEVMGYYNSPFIFGIFRGYAQYNLNLGVQKMFLNKNATVKLSYNNILRNESYRGAAEFANLNMSIFNTWQFRTVNLSFSYKFGSATIKAARERKTGTSDEQNRAG